MTQGIVTARSTSEQATSRRALLRGVAALGAGVALGAPSALTDEAVDPHPAWYAEWEALVAWCNGPGPGARELQDCTEWQGRWSWRT